MVLLEYQNIKIFWQKVTLEIGLKKVLWLKKIKNTLPWTYVINDLNGAKIVGTFYENRLQEIIEK